MSVRSRIVLVTVWVLSIAGVAVWTSAQAQVPLPRRSPSSPSVISGNDIGFALESVDGKVAIGRWKVRVNGEWLDVRPGGGRGRVFPLSSE
jgi:hypothetical protein